MARPPKKSSIAGRPALKRSEAKAGRRQRPCAKAAHPARRAARGQKERKSPPRGHAADKHQPQSRPAERSEALQYGRGHTTNSAGGPTKPQGKAPQPAHRDNPQGIKRQTDSRPSRTAEAAPATLLGTIFIGAARRVAARNRGGAASAGQGSPQRRRRHARPHIGRADNNDKCPSP